VLTQRGGERISTTVATTVETALLRGCAAVAWIGDPRHRQARNENESERTRNGSERSEIEATGDEIEARATKSGTRERD
jgi:hypothetical protein